MFGRRPKTSALYALWNSFLSAINPASRGTKIPDASGDEHLDRESRRRLLTASRDLERNSHLYDAALTNWATLAVGDGPELVPASGDETWDALVAAAWKDQAAKRFFDATGRNSWGKLIELLARSVVRDGTLFVFVADNGQSTLVETTEYDKVVADKNNLVMQYLLGRDQKPYDATTVSMVAHRLRPSQTFGYPVLTAGLFKWERVESLLEAEIVSAEASSLPYVHFSSDKNAPPVVFGKPPTAEPPTGTAQGFVRQDAGVMIVTPPGVNANPWAPARPNTNVPQFARMNLRTLVAPLLPYEVAFMDPNGLNYAGIRGIGRLAHRRLSDQRINLLEPALDLMFERWFLDQTRKNKLPHIPTWRNHTWSWPDLELRDREKDAQADEREMNNGTLTLQDRLGPNWRRTVDQRAIEKKYLKEKGLLP